jgi:uncharacterized glyoxalase superfamily protein PhnB
MVDDIVRGWAPVYPHLRYHEPGEAIAWLSRVFGFRARVRMARPDGGIIVAKLESPGGGLVMVAERSPDFQQWIRERCPTFASRRGGRGPTCRTHDRPGQRRGRPLPATDEGAIILMAPTDQPWGLRSYAAIDLQGHQWEFSQVLRAVEPEAWGATRID